MRICSEGFGFENSDNFYSLDAGDSLVMAIDNQLGIMNFAYIDKFYETVKLDDICYMHELQQALYDERDFIETFEPEWKGVDKHYS